MSNIEGIYFDTNRGTLEVHLEDGTVHTTDIRINEKHIIKIKEEESN